MSELLPAPEALCDGVSLVSMIPHIRTFARFLTRDPTEAEDLVQDALLRAWRSRDSYRAGSNMRAWLRTIVRNQYYSGKRRSWRECYLDPKVVEPSLVALDNPESPIELEEIHRAIQQLSDDHRRAILMIAVAGLPYQKAAELSGCSIGTIKSRVSRARQALSAILEAGDLVAEPVAADQVMGAIFAEADVAVRAQHSLARGPRHVEAAQLAA